MAAFSRRSSKPAPVPAAAQPDLFTPADPAAPRPPAVFTARSRPVARPAVVEPSEAVLARSALETKLVEIARVLGRKAGLHGVTVSDVRHTAEQAGLLTNQQVGRTLSWLSVLMARAGLEATGRTRRSTIRRSHGNRHTVWVAKGLLPTAAGR